MHHHRSRILTFLTLACCLGAAGCIDAVREGLAGGLQAGIHALVEEAVLRLAPGDTS